MLDQRANFGVDHFVIAGSAAGLGSQVNTTVFMELVQPIDGVFGELERQAKGLVVESAHFLQIVLVNIVFGGDWL